ncbi:uncharacterized protein JCM15063_001448 [Sporobolomyces koalae]|uniref:uncharacterized protein n=1 Tax=Sporobolomyces koalae TaxID=500713 RepID=UPI00316D5227
MSDVDDSDLPNKKRRTETQPEVLPTAPHNAEPQPPAKPKRREFKCYCGPCYRQGGEAGFSLVSEKTLTAHRKKHKEELTEAYHLELAKRKAEGIGGGGAQHAQRVQGVHIDDGSGVDCGSMTLSNDRPPRRYGPALRRNLPEDVVEEQFQQEAAEEKERQRELRAERVAEEAAKEAERGTAVEEDEKQEESLRAAGLSRSQVLISRDPVLLLIPSWSLESQGLGRSKLEMIKLLNFKLKHNLTPECMEDLIALRPQVRGTEEEEDITQYELFKLLARLSHTSMKEYDCCRKSCMAFTGKHVQDDICAICGTSRWVEGSGNQKSATRFWYYSLSEQLKSRYRDPTYAEMARYRAKFCRSEEVLRDVFDGDLYQEQLNAKVRIDDEELECRFYENDVDACIGILLDGFRIFDRDEHNCWPVLAIDYNLPPAERYKTENVLIVALIPGPKSPKNLNSFLRPFVDDTKIWARHGSGMSPSLLFIP